MITWSVIRLLTSNLLKVKEVFSEVVITYKVLPDKCVGALICYIIFNDDNILLKSLV